MVPKENHSDMRRRATLINVFADGVVSSRDDDGTNAPEQTIIQECPKVRRWVVSIILVFLILGVN